MPRHSLLALVAASITAIAACGGPAEPTPPPPPPPPPPVTVSVSPKTLDLVVSETAALTATVTNSSSAVTWSSATPAVATVDGSGLVTAVTEGLAKVVATVVGQTNVTDTASVTVSAPSIEVTGITSGGTPVNLNAVTGEVTVELDAIWPSGFNGVVEVLLGGTVAASVDIVNGVPATGAPAPQQAAPSGQGGAELVPATSLEVSFDTRAIEELPPARADVAAFLASLPSTGLTPMYPNGTYPIGTQIRSGSSVLATGTAGNADITNVLGLVYVLTEIMGPSLDHATTGRTYTSGDLVVDIVAASYDGATLQSMTETIERVEVLRGPAAPSIVSTSTNGNIVNIIRSKNQDASIGGAGGLEGRYEPTDVIVTTDLGGTYSPDILNGSTAFSGWPTIYSDVDNKGPTFRDPFAWTMDQGQPNAWIGKHVSFDWRTDLAGWTETGANSDVYDDGVGVANRWFTVGSDPTPVVKGGDIPETTTASLTFHLHYADLFGQSSSIPHSDGVGALTPGGVDYGRNTKVDVLATSGGQPGIVRGDVNVPAGTKAYWNVTGLGPSGLRDYLVGATADYSGVTPADACVEGTYDADATHDTCRPTSLATPVYDPTAFLAALPGSANVTLAVGVRDRAYNKQLSHVQITQDLVLPTASGFAPQQSYTSGLLTTFAFDVTDDFTVSATAGAFGYVNRPELLVFGVQTWYERMRRETGGFVPAASASFDVAVPGFLELSTANSFGRDVPTGTGISLARLVYGGTDAAGNVGQAVHDFTGSVSGSFVSLNSPGFDGATVRSPSLTVCHNPRGKKDCQGVPETVRQFVDLFFQAGAMDRIDNLRFSKQASIGGLDLSYLYAPANRVEMNFGSFRQVIFSSDFNGADLEPGIYSMGTYGFGNAGTAWKQRSWTLEVKAAF